MASSITARSPRSSISRMVNARTPDSRTCGRSVASTSRRPTITVLCGATLGRKPNRSASGSGPMPSRQASGMPWILPLGLESGVFISACASSQIRPTRWPRSRKCRDTPLTVPIATE